MSDGVGEERAREKKLIKTSFVNISGLFFTPALLTIFTATIAPFFARDSAFLTVEKAPLAT